MIDIIGMSSCTSGVGIGSDSIIISNEMGIVYSVNPFFNLFVRIVGFPGEERGGVL